MCTVDRGSVVLAMTLEQLALSLVATSLAHYCGCLPDAYVIGKVLEGCTAGKRIESITIRNGLTRKHDGQFVVCALRTGIGGALLSALPFQSFSSDDGRFVLATRKF
jgi:hypothetical protein